MQRIGINLGRKKSCIREMSSAPSPTGVYRSCTCLLSQVPEELGCCSRCVAALCLTFSSMISCLNQSLPTGGDRAQKGSSLTKQPSAVICLSSVASLVTY